MDSEALNVFKWSRGSLGLFFLVLHSRFIGTRWSKKKYISDLEKTQRSNIQTILECVLFILIWAPESKLRRWLELELTKEIWKWSIHLGININISPNEVAFHIAPKSTVSSGKKPISFCNDYILRQGWDSVTLIQSLAYAMEAMWQAINASKRSIHSQNLTQVTNFQGLSPPKTEKVSENIVT